MQQLLGLNVVDQTLLYAFYGLSVLACLYLAVRRPPPPRWLLVAFAGLAGGALAGAITLFISEAVVNVFGLPLESDTRAWVISAFAGVGLAVVNLWRSRWWRKAAAVIAVLVFVSTAALAINAGYGLNPTLGAMLGLNQAQHLALPALNPKARQDSGVALWQSWTPPAGMPATGRSGAVSIPATASGFRARDAYLYLPPAALVADPPPLPIIIMMMGQPGGPEQNKSAVQELNALAQRNHGLAPLFLTIDQLGNPYQNPVCVDSDKGKVYTYVTTDVVNFIRTRLNVSSARVQWAVAGYSNGGECALSFGAKRPELFGSLLDISGELEPIDGSPENTVKTIFGGNQAAFNTEKPATILKAHQYSDSLAIFTSGALDPVYGPQAAAAEGFAKAAGMTTRRFVGEGIGHRGDSVDYGLKTGLPLLYERFGLMPPGSS